MKNKLIVVVCLIIILSLVTACGKQKDSFSKLSDCKDSVSSSLSLCNEFRTEIEIKDNGVTVYKSDKIVAKVDGNAQVTTKTSELSSSFNLVENTSVDTYSISDVFKLSFDLSDANVDAYTLNDGILNMTVSQNKMSSLLGGNGFGSGSNVVFKFINKKQINEITYSYKSTSNKDVSVKISFNY